MYDLKIEWSQEWEDIEHIYEFNFLEGNNEVDVTTLQPDGRVMHTTRPVNPLDAAAAEAPKPATVVHASPSLQPAAACTVGAGLAGLPPFHPGPAQHGPDAVKSPERHPAVAPQPDSTASSSTDLPPPITVITNVRARSRSTIVESTDAVLSPMVTSASPQEEPPVLVTRRSSMYGMPPTPDSTPIQQPQTSPVLRSATSPMQQRIQEEPLTALL